jgi:hypothetical protein
MNTGSLTDEELIKTANIFIQSLYLPQEEKRRERRTKWNIKATLDAGGKKNELICLFDLQISARRRANQNYLWLN